MQGLREIRAWNLANSRNRKTRSGILRHINTWLKKEQDRAHRSRDDPADVTAGLRKWAARYGIETSLPDCPRQAGKRRSEVKIERA
ncbi:MAG: hypothetical protein JRG77_10135 [Deltaproteobacteria bacterium]|nr:hypothetical protein [Deltaproteobacteria bacterium]